jgi:drug/metabolite transporter (DMT)-like permease
MLNAGLRPTQLRFRMLRAHAKYAGARKARGCQSVLQLALSMNFPKVESRWVSIALALFVVFLWATSWILIKIGLQEIPALTFAGLRYFLAFLLLLPVFFVTNGASVVTNLSRRKVLELAGLGLLLYSATQGAQFIALAYMPAVTVNLLWSFSPVAVALLGLRFLNERLTVMQLVGVLMAVAGAVIYFFPAELPSNYLIGILVSLGGVLSNAGASVLGRHLNRSRELSPLVITIFSMGIGSIVLLVVGISMQGLPRIGWQGWVIIAWLALVNTALAFTIWNLTLRSLSATESSVINGTMLIWIPILAVVFLNEQVSSKEIIGLVVAGAGTLVVQLRQPSIIRRLIARGG